MPSSSSPPPFKSLPFFYFFFFHRLSSSDISTLRIIIITFHFMFYHCLFQSLRYTISVSLFFLFTLLPLFIFHHHFEASSFFFITTYAMPRRAISFMLLRHIFSFMLDIMRLRLRFAAAMSLRHLRQATTFYNGYRLCFSASWYGFRHFITAFHVSFSFFYYFDYAMSFFISINIISHRDIIIVIFALTSRIIYSSFRHYQLIRHYEWYHCLLISLLFSFIIFSLSIMIIYLFSLLSFSIFCQLVTIIIWLLLSHLFLLTTFFLFDFHQCFATTVIISDISFFSILFPFFISIMPSFFISSLYIFHFHYHE